MSDKVTTAKQFQKLINAFDILFMGIAVKPRNQPKNAGGQTIDLTNIMNNSRVHGMICGRMHERFNIKEEISLPEAQAMLKELQDGLNIRTPDPHAPHDMSSFLAHTAENLEQAFDIALHNRRMPTLPAGVLGGPRRRI